MSEEIAIVNNHSLIACIDGPLKGLIVENKGGDLMEIKRKSGHRYFYRLYRNPQAGVMFFQQTKKKPKPKRPKPKGY